MIPLRLVIDTNILVSAGLKPDGLQRTVVLLAITKPARLYIWCLIILSWLIWPSTGRLQYAFSRPCQR